MYSQLSECCLNLVDLFFVSSKPLMEICLQSNVDKNGSNDHTFLMTQVSLFAFGWMCFTSKSASNKLFSKHCLINNWIVVKVLWKPFSKFWNKCSILISFSYLMLSYVLVNDKDENIETSMAQLKLTMINKMEG